MKIVRFSYLSTVVLPNSLGIAFLYYRIANGFTIVEARILIPEGTCQASDKRVGSGVNG